MARDLVAREKREGKPVDYQTHPRGSVMLAAVRSFFRRLFWSQPAAGIGESDPMYMGEEVRWVKTTAAGKRIAG